LPAGFAFSLFTPEATLFDDDGNQLITHFFSPNDDPRLLPPERGTIRVTWEDSRDSSRVWAALVQQSSDAPFVQPDAVAWLKLQTVGVAAGPTGGVSWAHRAQVRRDTDSGFRSCQSAFRILLTVSGETPR